MIADTAVQHKVDVIGLSCLAGAHKLLAPRVLEILRKKGVGQTLIIAGGIIPDEDIPFLTEKGIKGIFGPGTSIETIANFINKNLNRRK